MVRPAASCVLTLVDAEVLQGWLRKTSLPQSLALGVWNLLRLAGGQSPKEISAQLQASAPVVFNRRKRYQEAGLEGQLFDAPEITCRQSTLPARPTCSSSACSGCGMRCWSKRLTWLRHE